MHIHKGCINTPSLLWNTVDRGWEKKMKLKLNSYDSGVWKYLIKVFTYKCRYMVHVYIKKAMGILVIVQYCDILKDLIQVQSPLIWLTFRKALTWFWRCWLQKKNQYFPNFYFKGWIVKAVENCPPKEAVNINSEYGQGYPGQLWLVPTRMNYKTSYCSEHV